MANIYTRQNIITRIRPQVGAYNTSEDLGKPGNILWLKADAHTYSDAVGTPAVNGGKVNRWLDNSIYNNYGYQDTLSRQPTYQTNQLNGLPILSYNASNQTGTIVQNQSYFNVYNHTIFVVGKYYSGSGFIGKGYNSADTTIHRKMQLTPYSSNLLCYWAGTDGNSGNAGNIPAGKTRLDWNIYCVRTYRNNLVYYNINGQETWNQSSINISKYNPVRLGIGVMFVNDWAEFSTIDVAEIIAFDYLLTERSVNGIMHYLSNKWGLTITNPTPPTLTTRTAAGTRPLVP